MPTPTFVIGALLALRLVDGTNLQITERPTLPQCDARPIGRQAPAISSRDPTPVLLLSQVPGS